VSPPSPEATSLELASLRQLALSLKEILWPKANPQTPWSPETLEEVAHAMILYGFGPGPASVDANTQEDGWWVLGALDETGNSCGGWLVSPRGVVTKVFWEYEVGPETKSPGGWHVEVEFRGLLHQAHQYLTDLALDLGWVEHHRNRWPSWLVPKEAVPCRIL
jgi:hypothetical protein